MWHARLERVGTPWLDDDRDTVTVTGADAMTYLQSQLSQEIRDLEVGDARWTFLLEPNGRIDVLARVTRDADETYRLDTDAGFGEALLARVNRFKIRVRADVELTSAVPSRPSDPAGTRTSASASRPDGRGWVPRSSPARRFRPRPV